MAKKFTPPLCGCADRSAYVRATHKCRSCGDVCQYCIKACKKSGHKTRKLTVAETGTQEDWIRAFGYNS